MKIRRQITGALCGLLNAFSSRYSDYKGYWMFGLLIRESDSFSFDLMREGEVAVDSPLVVAARQRARLIFQEQLQRSHIPGHCVAEVKLTIKKEVEGLLGSVNGHTIQGFQVSLSAEALSDLGKKYQCKKLLFVAPHNPTIECRSTRWDAGRGNRAKMSPRFSDLVRLVRSFFFR